MSGARNDLMGGWDEGCALSAQSRTDMKVIEIKRPPLTRSRPNFPSHQPSTSSLYLDFNFLALALSLRGRRRWKSFERRGRSDSMGAGAKAKRRDRRTNRINRMHGNHNNSLSTDSIQALSKTRQGSHLTISNCEWWDTWPLCGCVDKRVHESTKVKMSEIMRDERTDRTDRCNDRSPSRAQTSQPRRNFWFADTPWRRSPCCMERRHDERRGNWTMQPNDILNEGRRNPESYE